jgi:NAD(P)-dependent dehydrogenase (short-subunit alcohol dehydrogenase family)
MSSMNGKVVLITGASSGIGRATAEAFAAKGAGVALAARREDELAALVTEIETRGGKATFVRTDVAVAKDVERMVTHTIATFGCLDYAVNNAGIEGQLAGITDLSEEEWDRVLDINLKGTFLCMKYEARAMLEGGHGGAIVNVGSVNSFRGFPLRLGVRCLETWTDRADYERFRRAGTAGHQGQPRVPRNH